MRDVCVCPGGGRLQELLVNWCLRGPSTHLLVPGTAASVRAGVAAAEEGMGRGGDRAHGFQLFPAWQCPRRMPEGRVLPVLLSPPELPQKTIYAYICGRKSDGGAESPSEGAQRDSDPL